MQLTPSTLRRAVAHLRQADPVMAGIVERIGPCRLTVYRDPHHRRERNALTLL